MKIMHFALLFLCLFFTAAKADTIHEKLTILGSGPAGLSAAIYASQAGYLPIVIQGEECTGQLESVFWMENYPGFDQGIRGDELILRLRNQAEKFGARFQEGSVINVDLTKRPFTIHLSQNNVILTDALIIASGTSKRWLGLETEEALKGKGVYGAALCDGPLFLGKEVVVLGGSDSSLEEALLLTEYARGVTLIHRKEALSASQYLLDKVLAHPKITVILNQAVEEILDVSKGAVTAVVVKDLKTQKITHIPCEGVFVSIGRVPNTEIFKGQLPLTKEGLIEVRPHSTETGVIGVFAAGDVMDIKYRKAITAASYGCMAALDAIRFLNQE